MNGESGRAEKRLNLQPPAPGGVPQIVLLLEVEPIHRCHPERRWSAYADHLRSGHPD